MKFHEEMTTFLCDICKKQFHLRWRLNKHRASHDEQSKFCHYYNNDKNCPFEVLGCKFKHEPSDRCKFDKRCLFKLCQFQHSKRKQANILNENNDTNDQNEKELDNEEIDNHETARNTGDNSHIEDTDENVESDESSTDDEDETEIIYQRFLKNHEKIKNEMNNKEVEKNKPEESENEKIVSEIMKQFKFVSS